MILRLFAGPRLILRHEMLVWFEIVWGSDFLVKVLDAQCLGISSKIESAFRFRLGFGYTTRLVHGCEPWPNMKSAALPLMLAANSPAACQRNFASLIGEGGKTILPKHIRCMASWRNVFIDSFDLFDEKEKNMEKSCWRVDLEPTGLAFDKNEISISWISGKIDTTTAWIWSAIGGQFVHNPHRTVASLWVAYGYRL